MKYVKEVITRIRFSIMIQNDVIKYCEENNISFEKNTNLGVIEYDISHKFTEEEVQEIIKIIQDEGIHFHEYPILDLKSHFGTKVEFVDFIKK